MTPPAVRLDTELGGVFSFPRRVATMTDPHDPQQLFGSPSGEYMQFKGDDKPREIDGVTDVSLHDVLVAFLRSADAIHHELM